MSLALEALIKRTQAAIESEADPRKLRAHQSNLAAYLVAKSAMDDDDDDDDDKKKSDDDDDGDESKASKAAKAAAKAKGKAEAAKCRAKAAEHKARAAECEEAAKAAEAEDEGGEDESAKSAAAALATIESLTGLTGDAALGAIRALAGTAAQNARDVAEIKRSQSLSEKQGLIESIRKSTTKDERAWLAEAPLEQVRSFAAMRAKSGLVITEESALVRPKTAVPGTEASLSAETLEYIEAAVSGYPGDKAKFRAQLVEANLATHKKQIDAALNGAGRY
jgi:hypothetical protein